ncbi:hypothetical protein MOX02_30470 [Methylobacterium oxalidis]|uniref:Uncharacterized protein n=1 Tax=Methylobacterium oxalidis TaxID=944322 RepID=A0A512J567_9HYPH|nr:hypothetical protein MOX02_30470 [Methylobacterium oxalidis]GLS63747.1 hypothetical protein GCM10007888_21280 [Methylobacterium oxalidis]
MGRARDIDIEAAHSARNDPQETIQPGTPGPAPGSRAGRETKKGSAVAGAPEKEVIRQKLRAGTPRLKPSLAPRKRPDASGRWAD